MEDWNEGLEILWENVKGVFALVHKQICHKTMNTGPSNCQEASSVSIDIDSLLIPILDSHFLYCERWNRPYFGDGTLN